MTSKGSPVWSWLGILCGALFFEMGFEKILDRRHIGLGICEIAAGISMGLSHLGIISVIRAGPLVVEVVLIFAGAGIAEVLLGYIVWAIPMFAAALLFLFIGRKNRRQTSGIPVA
jgi:hypothetical protein